jgi:hypothetical protein
MSDWAVGDLALCINDAVCPFAGHNGGMVNGKIYTVRDIIVVDGQTGLRFKDLPDPGPNDCRYLAFSETRFRKIRPDEHEACEPEFVKLLKRSKRKVSA